MRKFRFATFFATVVAAGATTSTADAAFSGNVCGLLTAKQVATVHVSPLKCTPMKSFTTPAGTNYSGQWGGTGATASHLFIGIVLYKNTTYFQAAKQNLHFSGPKKVTGIGSVAYETGSGHFLTMISFVVGNYIASFNLRTSQPLQSIGPFNALARAVAAKL